jgi:hypothetical protein
VVLNLREDLVHSRTTGQRGSATSLYIAESTRSSSIIISKGIAAVPIRLLSIEWGCFIQILGDGGMGGRMDGWRVIVR